MSTVPIAPAGAPPASTRWLWVVRIAAGISILLLGRSISSIARWMWATKGRTGELFELGVLGLTLVPYLMILFLAGGKPVRKGMALAATTGLGGAIGAFLRGMFSSFHATTTLPVLPVQILLLVGAYRTDAAMRRLAEGIGWEPELTP